MVQIPLTEVYQTGDAGSTVALGQTAVDGNLVGRSCSVTATISNNDSLHPGNTLVVTSGGASVQISGIEDAVGSSTLSGGTIVLGDSISASVVLGADGATSIGSRLSVACTALPDTEPPVATPGNPSYTG